MSVTDPDLGRISIVQQNDASLRPTDEAYGEWQFAYDYFNRRLFDGCLPNCLITLTRKARTLGYFAPGRFSSRGGAIVHEISLNPQYLELRGDYLALSTLVHEQAHVFRHAFGPREGGTRGYHDRAWAEVMLRIGLVPSDTGLPGGKQTGPSMSHYIADGGPFDLACRELLLAGFKISWRDCLRKADAGDGDSAARRRSDREGSKSASRSHTRTKFSCQACGLNAWARPSAQLACLACSIVLSPQKQGVP